MYDGDGTLRSSLVGHRQVVSCQFAFLCARSAVAALFPPTPQRTTESSPMIRRGNSSSGASYRTRASGRGGGRRGRGHEDDEVRVADCCRHDNSPSSYALYKQQLKQNESMLLLGYLGLKVLLEI